MKKERGVEANSPRRRKTGAQCFPWGTCKFPEANEPKVPWPTWFALNNRGTMFVPKNFSPFAPGIHVSLGGIGPICLGKLCFHKELGLNCSRKPCFSWRNTQLFFKNDYPSFLHESHQWWRFPLQKYVNPRPPTQKLKLSTITSHILIYKNIKSQRYLTQSSQFLFED